MLETDPKLLVDACNGSPRRSYLHFIVIVSECIELFKHFENVLVQFVYRFTNEDAHLLVISQTYRSGEVLFPPSYRMSLHMI